MFLMPTPQVLQKVITGLDELYEQDLSGRDMHGDLYEYMLGKLATAGQNGQFRTPKQIRDLMVRLVAPTPDDKICDPACGTAGFLVTSAEYIRETYEAQMTADQWQHFDTEAFSGFDTDRTMLRLSAMNLMLHAITNPHIDYQDSLSKQNGLVSRYDVILATLDTAALLKLRQQQLAELEALIQSVFYQMFGDPVRNEKGRKLHPIGGITKSIIAGWSVNGEVRTKKHDEIGVLKVSAVTQGVFRPDEYKVISKEQMIKKYVFPEICFPRKRRFNI